MAIKIISTHISHQNYDLGHVPIDFSRKTGVLIRQSRKGADKDHYESRLRQESLIPLAVALRGDTDASNILVYDEGAGVSGTKGYDQRPKLSKLYIDIANGVIGSIVVARADRLFRDEHFRNVSMFTEIAEAKKIILVVPGRAIYDFTKIKDLQAFQKEMQDAYNYITTQVAYLIETRQQKVQRGLYGGGHLPAPYVIDRNAWKDEQVPIIYRPWQEQTCNLFERFIDYDFSLARVVGYIESLPYLFPYPSAEDVQKYKFPIVMTRVTGGYTFTSIDSIKHYLSNLTLGGYAKIGKDEEGNELLLAGAFEPAVPMELLDPCYAAITGHYLDGSRFEKWGEGSRRPRTHIKAWESKAVFHGFLDSVDGAVSFTMDKQKGQGAYTCHKGMSIGGRRIVNRIGIIQTQKVWSVPHEELDHIILDRLCNLAQHDSDLADRVKAFWVSRKTSEMDEAQVLKTQIEKTQAQIKHLDRLLTNPASPLTEEAEKRYIKMLKEAEVDLQRLLKKQAEQNEHEDPETVIPNFYYVLLHLPTAYKTLTNESQKKMIRKVIKQVKLNIVSPHLFLLCIEWESGIALRPDIALVWRGVTPNNADEWSEEEDNIMRMYYPDSPQIELMQALPHRAWYRICDRAQVLNLRRNIPNQGRTRVNMYHRTMRYDDLEAIARLVQGEEEKERVRQIANKLAQQTMRGGLSAHWWLPLNSVSYACLDIEAVSEANNIELLHLSGFPYGVPHQGGSLPH